MLPTSAMQVYRHPQLCGKPKQNCSDCPNRQLLPLTYSFVLASWLIAGFSTYPADPSLSEDILTSLKQTSEQFHPFLKRQLFLNRRFLLDWNNVFSKSLSQLGILSLQLFDTLNKLLAFYKPVLMIHWVNHLLKMQSLIL